MPHPGWGFRLMTILTLTTGTIFIMWLGEQITERGIGNGISLIIFAGIVGEPAAGDLRPRSSRSANQTISILALLSVLVFMAGDHRARSSSSSGRSGGSRCSTPSASSAGAVYGGQNTYLPLRVNTGGVIPIIFAISILSLPQLPRADLPAPTG